MLFSTPIFLFAFLPTVLALYYCSPRFLKNTTLLVASLFFYAWGEVFYIAVMLVSIGCNYIVGRLIYSANSTTSRKVWVVAGITVNLLLLISFKYANFIADNLSILLSWFGDIQLQLNPIHLPLGISFFTFQALSYIVDVYRKEVACQRNVFNLALYISLFPQLIAGPIVRYHDVAAQITGRQHSIELFGSGARRFVYGLSKKMLIANPLGEVADIVFALPASELTLPLAWIGILAYTLQIYFDFSGYSDMAIGLGRLFGFRFLENFNYPYVSRSIREFWRRWHISLSSWFRDYVYISLGGNRVSAYRVYANLLIVFVLTGFWHGASWNFLIWGLFHGAFLSVEHAGFSKLLDRAPTALRHGYVLAVAIIGWVFFRADDLTTALAYLHSLFDVGNRQVTALTLAQVVSTEALLAFCVGCLIALPVLPWLSGKGSQLVASKNLVMAAAYRLPQLVILIGLFYLTALKLASSTYNPFIYFRF